MTTPHSPPLDVTLLALSLQARFAKSPVLRAEAIHQLGERMLRLIAAAEAVADVRRGEAA